MSITNHTELAAPRNKRRKIGHGSESVSTTDVRLGVPDTRDQDESQSGPEDESEEKKSGRLGLKSVRHTHHTLQSTSSSKSPFLALQLNRLLAASTPDYDAMLSKAENLTDRLKSLIRSTPETEPLSISEAEKCLRKDGQVAIPFPAPRPSQDTNLKFQFKAPKSIDIEGSFTQRLSATGDQAIGLNAEIPPDLLQEKDYLNLRAFYKRAFYIAYIAASLLKQANDDFDVRYEYTDEIVLLPCLKVIPQQQQEQKVEFLITVSFPKGSFPSGKYTPDKNCVRPKDDSGVMLESTPFYNSCLSSNTGVTACHGFLVRMTRKVSAFADSCRAAQIWLQKRGFGSNISSGGFGLHEWAVMCATLLETGGHRNQPLLSNRYSHLQLLKAMFQVLSGRDLTEPWILRSATLNLPASDVPVFYDCQLGFNILYKMSSWSYQNLRHQAHLTIAALNSKHEENFDSAFTLQISEPMLHYDELISISLPEPPSSQAAFPQRELRKLYAVLKRGLSDRVSLLDLNCTPLRPWSVRKGQSPASEDQRQIHVGLLLNPDVASRLVDHGPPADEHDAAAEFRQFWGEKAELRRFKDGSISESLVWSPNEPVILQIMRHLMIRHFKQPSSAVTYRSHKLESIILAQSSDPSAAEAFKLISDQLQTLSTTLHQLEGLPLPIRSISPADAALRSSSISNPLGPATARPINILIQFDSSTRWPDSLPAIQHTKIAFLVKLSDLLSSTQSSLTTRVGLENTSTSTSGHLNTSFLDIIYPPSTPAIAPICFRLRIHHDRELHLLQTTLADKSLHGSVRDNLTSALATHKAQYLAAPKHTTAIRNLVTRFPPLSPTIRLLKRWISSHLLSRLLPSPILEIVAAHVFLHPYPWSTPGSATTAFYRCLHLLSRWDWASQALTIDLTLSQEMTVSQRKDVKTRFAAWRKLDPNMNNVVWFVGTSVDETGVVWTTGGKPEKVVAARVTALARASVHVLTSKGVDMGAEEDDKEANALFRSPMDMYDFQLHLHKAVVRAVEPKDGRKEGFRNLQIDDVDDAKVGFDPVELYLTDLEKSFGNAALFFYDGQGGKVIAGLWRPGVLGRKEWRVRMSFSTTPVVVKEEGGEGTVTGEFNKEGVLAEMRLLGEGIVKSVSLREE